MIRRHLVYIVGNDPIESETFIRVMAVKFLDELKVAVSPIEEVYLENEVAEG